MSSEFTPESARIHFDLGEAQQRAGDLPGALQCFQQAVALQPLFAEAHFRAGNIHLQLDHSDAALEAFTAAVNADPRHFRAMLQLANTFRQQGLLDAAMPIYRHIVQLAPKFADAAIELANAYAEQGQAAEALAAYERVRTLEPDRPELNSNIALCHEVQGNFAKALSVLRDEHRTRPSWSLGLRMETLVCPFAQSASAMADDRARVESAVKNRLSHPVKLKVEELHAAAVEPPMALVYQGLDERPLKELYAKLFQPSFPRCDARGGFSKPRHLCVVVTHGHEGVFIKCMKGLLEKLSPDRFRITVACSRSGRNLLRQSIGAPQIEYFALPRRIDQAAELLQTARFDMLLYWEIGTDATNYFLPFYRLAPVQCATFGWPVTSGIPTVDYFISSAELETPDSDQFFSERLVRLPTLPTYYEPPEIPAGTKERADFNLPKNVHLYFCGQRLRKFHPDFDRLIAGILREDSRGLFVCVGDREPFMSKLFQERFSSLAADVADRVRVVPWLSTCDYLQLTSLANVVLDTPHYGGGANTVYDALAAGRPLVTLPGRFQRGRYAMAANRRLGLEDCIATSADDYVRRAVQIAREPDLAAKIERQIADRRDALFRDERYIEAMEEFIDRATSEAAESAPS